MVVLNILEQLRWVTNSLIFWKRCWKCHWFPDIHVSKRYWKNSDLLEEFPPFLLVSRPAERHSPSRRSRVFSRTSLQWDMLMKFPRDMTWLSRDAEKQQFYCKHLLGDQASHPTSKVLVTGTCWGGWHVQEAAGFGVVWACEGPETGWATS